MAQGYVKVDLDYLKMYTVNFKARIKHFKIYKIDYVKSKID